MEPLIEAFSTWSNAWRATMPTLSVGGITLAFGIMALGVRGIVDFHAFLRRLRD
jgi:hypothetical protein